MQLFMTKIGAYKPYILSGHSVLSTNFWQMMRKKAHVREHLLAHVFSYKSLAELNERFWRSHIIGIPLHSKCTNPQLDISLQLRPFQQRTYVKSFQSHKAALICFPNPQPDHSLHCKTNDTRLCCIARFTRLPPSFRWYSLCLATEGWPGRVNLGGWLHTEMIYPSADSQPSKY